MSIKNKNVYILGASGKIGLAVAKFLSSKKANVINLDIIQQNYDQIAFEKFNVEELDHKSEEIKRITDKYGEPDIFINCSYPRTDEWAELTFKKAEFSNLKKNIDLHLVSYIWTANKFAEQMILKKVEGSIILTSSIYGLVPQRSNLYNGTNIAENFAYTAIKSAINHHCRQMASFFGKNNIRINCISPGGLEGGVAGQSFEQDDVFKKKYIERTALKRMCKTSDLVEAYYFLSSPNSKYITGQNLVIDGGFSIN